MLYLLLFLTKCAIIIDALRERNFYLSMKKKLPLFTRFLLPLFGAILAVLSFSTLFTSTPVSAIEKNQLTEIAVPKTPETPESPDTEAPDTPEAKTPKEAKNTPEATPTSEAKDLCLEQTGAMYWLVCPTTGVIAKAIDSVYSTIEDLLAFDPIIMDSDSPIHIVWSLCRDLTNIVFIIFIIIIAYSQFTGLGITNYGIKRTLPRIIIAAILVNLSFFLCSLAVDLSNIFGGSLRNFFISVQESTIANNPAVAQVADVSWADLVSVFTGATAIGGIAIGMSGGLGAFFWMLVPILLGAIASIVIGLITIALRQAVVFLLVMISPLAFITYLLPNTEKWFTKWKNLFVQMLVFYPTFSLLFGASQLAGWILMTTIKSGFGLILGMAVQVFPLFFAWSLMKMSGTVLGAVSSKLQNLSAKPLGASRRWADSHRAESRAKHLRNNTTPSAKLMNYLEYRKGLREYNTEQMTNERSNMIKERIANRASSYLGRGEDGLDVFSENPNKYTINTKRASLAKLRASTAAQRLSNVDSSYGTTFANNPEAKRLAGQTGEVFKDYAAQEFLTVNNAQADEDFLFDAYTKAATTRISSPYEYNRLVKNAAGDLGLLGESSIMGQAIQKNARTESRRRAEALIMISKFGYDRAAFHSAATGQLRNADGYAIDENENVIEDSMFRLKPGKRYVPWTQYERDPVSGDHVAYFDMTNDRGEPVQRVYMNDNGYMKELLTNDIMIGDPVNRLYEMSVGKGGPLRKYFSTIAGSITSWKEHSGGTTPMLAAMMSRGTLDSPGKHAIGYLQSLKVATKASSFLTNDKFIINDLNKVFVSAYPELFKTADDTFTAEAAQYLGISPDTPWVPFESFISDQDINSYLDVKEKQLGGLRFENGRWQEVPNNQNPTLEDKKNFILHDLIPGTIKKLFSLTNRTLSPNILENQKPPTAQALSDMLELFNIIGQSNPSIYDTTDPSLLKRLAEQAKKNAEELRTRGNAPNTEAPARSGDYTSLNDQILNNLRYHANRNYQDSPDRTIEEIREILNGNYSFNDTCAILASRIEHSESLDQITKTQLLDIITNSQAQPTPTSTEDIARGFADNQADGNLLENLRTEIESILGIL